MLIAELYKCILQILYTKIVQTIVVYLSSDCINFTICGADSLVISQFGFA